MITPNKFISFKESILSKLPLLCTAVYPIGLHELYMANENSFETIDEFMQAIDALYVLGKIHVDLTTGVITHAG